MFSNNKLQVIQLYQFPSRPLDPLAPLALFEQKKGEQAPPSIVFPVRETQTYRKLWISIV